MKDLKQIIRGFIRQKTHTLFSFLSISIGIICFSYIAVWAYSQLSYDKYIPDLNRIWLVASDDSVYKDFDTTMPLPLSELIRDKYSDLNCASYNYYAGKFKIKYKNIVGFDEITTADSQIINILPFKFVEKGQRELLNTNSLIICESIAKKYFGKKRAIGEVVFINDTVPFTIGGVFADFPENSTFKPKILCNFDDFGDIYYKCEDWNNYCYQVLVKTPPNFDTQNFSKEITLAIVELHETDEVFTLYPLSKMHLQSPGEKSMISHLLIIIISGLLLLIVSATNFINLLIAGYLKKIKMFNTKIILGAQKQHLIKYLLTETAIYFIVSAVCILILNNFIIPVLSQIVGLNLLTVFGYSRIIAVQLLIVIITYILVSIFPAFILGWGTSKLDKLNKKIKFRVNNLLIMGQFTLAIFIAVSAFFMHRQISFAISSNLGYNSENVIDIECYDYPLQKNRENVEHFLKTTPEIVSFSFTSSQLAGFTMRTTGFRHPLWSENEHEKYRVIYKTDNNFFKTMHIPIIAGRDFDNKKYNENRNIIINKTFAKDLGGIDSALNLKLKNGYVYTVVGVCDDFYFESMHQKIEPLVILCKQDNTHNIIVKTFANNNRAVSIKINKYLSSLSDAPFVIKPIKQQISEMYSDEENQQSILKLFAVISLLLSCMGLFGLVALELEQKTKEIGIRKVNGATAWEIIKMLNKDFVKWVAVAFIIAAPVAYYAMNRWLENFAYKISLSWWIFALAGFAVLLIALLTVSLQTYRAANKNPVEALRYE